MIFEYFLSTFEVNWNGRRLNYEFRKFILVHFVDESVDELSSGLESSDEDDDFFNVTLDPMDEGSKLVLLDDVCPAGCNPKTFEMAYGLRAQRLTLETNLLYERESLQKSSNYIVELLQCDKELAAKANERDKKMNELIVIICIWTCGNDRVKCSNVLVKN